ncbi:MULTISPECIES: mercuric transport protein MerTP [Olivibacter]|uniref:Mercuric transport protein MerT n=2 Tax=Sphingobacteriaceae TaxID=84566 RepID=F4C0Z0_SPHS2|nr:MULTISPECIES: mercuric transport protein MerTP [Olivibacter]QEL03882.1 mercuric transport protein MerTP [Olivibacter sp. LS-1]
MSKIRSNKALMGSGVFLALTSSLCCIVPFLAIVGGTMGAVSAFSWITAIRPYLLCATALILVFAFYRAYKPEQKDECGCKEKRGMWQSKTFLWIITAISILLSTFPYYASFLQKGSTKEVVINSQNISMAVLQVQGMSCAACEGHINKALQGKKGVQEVRTSYDKGESIVKFDRLLISPAQLSVAIENETGYKVKNIKTDDN